MHTAGSSTPQQDTAQQGQHDTAEKTQTVTQGICSQHSN
jgi:hypothetical protein